MTLPAVERIGSVYRIEIVPYFCAVFPNRRQGRQVLRAAESVSNTIRPRQRAGGASALDCGFGYMLRECESGADPATYSQSLCFPGFGNTVLRVTVRTGPVLYADSSAGQAAVSCVR